MKNLLLLLLITNCILVNSQINVGVDYNRSTYSSNVGITVGKQFKAHQISLGLRINDPKSSSRPLYNIDVHPTNFKEMLGVKLNYKYYIKTNLKVHPFLMLSSEYSHSPLRSDYLGEMDRDRVIDPDDYFQYYAGFVRLTGLYHIFDQRIGLGFTADITETFNFSIYGGSGLTWMTYDTGNLNVYMPGAGVNNFFGLGFGYTFK